MLPEEDQAGVAYGDVDARCGCVEGFDRCDDFCRRDGGVGVGDGHVRVEVVGELVVNAVNASTTHDGNPRYGADGRLPVVRLSATAAPPPPTKPTQRQAPDHRQRARDSCGHRQAFERA